MGLNLKALIEEIESKEDPCKGIFFRGRTSAFSNNGRIIQKYELRQLKLKSCKGCMQCGAFWEWFDNICPNEINLTHVEEGAVYTTKFVEDSRDWETGYVDDWHYEFIKVEEKKDERNSDRIIV